MSADPQHQPFDQADTTYQVLLTDEVALRLDDLAARRGQHWRSRQVATRKLARSRQDVDIDRLGAYGEYACCMLFGIEFNWHDDRPDGDIDGVLWGKTVQIKATPFGNRLLLFRDLDHFRADLAILAWVDLPLQTIHVAGWVSRRDFERRHTIQTVTALVGPQPALPIQQLRSPDSLVPTLLRLPHAAGPEEPR